MELLCFRDLAPSGAILLFSSSDASGFFFLTPASVKVLLPRGLSGNIDSFRHGARFFPKLWPVASFLVGRPTVSSFALVDSLRY